MYRASLPVIFVFLCSCANLENNNLENSNDWQTHQTQVLAQSIWQIQGRLNIRSEQDSSTPSINWLQGQDSYQINLSGPFSYGAIRIEGNDSLVTIEKSGEAPIIASNLSEISLLHLGFEFPSDELLYWIKGIPVPQRAADTQLNEQNLLQMLTQNDSNQNQWQLQYDRYRNHNGLLLPGRITVEHPPYRLTFLISRWQLDNL